MDDAGFDSAYFPRRPTVRSCVPTACTPTSSCTSEQVPVCSSMRGLSRSAFVTGIRGALRARSARTLGAVHRIPGPWPPRVAGHRTPWLATVRARACAAIASGTRSATPGANMVYTVGKFYTDRRAFTRSSKCQVKGEFRTSTFASQDIARARRECARVVTALADELGCAPQLCGSTSARCRSSGLSGDGRGAAHAP
jgi:hypothetical protein